MAAQEHTCPPCPEAALECKVILMATQEHTCPPCPEAAPEHKVILMAAQEHTVILTELSLYMSILSRGCLVTHISILSRCCSRTQGDIDEA